MSIPYLQMQTARDFGQSIGQGLNQGINNFFGQIPFFNNNSANANYYKAAAQLMPGYQAGSPVNVPQGIGSMSQDQISNLMGLMGQGAHNQQSLNTLNELAKRNNPNAQPYSADMSPTLAYQQYEAENGPVNTAKGQQAANEILHGPVYSALQPVLESNPATIFGTESPITQFSKDNPDVWQNLVGQSKTLEGLEEGLMPMVNSHQESLKEQQLKSENQLKQGQLELQKGSQNLQQQESAYKQQMQPLEIEKMKAEIEAYGQDKKGPLGQMVDDVQGMVTNGVLTPEAAHQFLQQSLQSQLQKSDPTVVAAEKGKLQEQLNTQNHITQLRIQASKTKDPAQRAILMDQAAQLGGVKPALKFPLKP